MVKVDMNFMLGDYRFATLLSSAEGENPLKVMLKFALKNGIIDSAIGTQREENGNFVPLIAMSEDDINRLSPIFFVQSGQNSLLKKAIQKYRLSRIGIVGPACIMDGVNKLQYYGMGCNWAKTRIALKVGLLCVGAVQEEGLKCELLEAGVGGDVKGNHLKENGIVFEAGNGEYSINLETHYSYINTGCRYCLNLSSRGVDLTFIPFKISEGFPVIVRSDRGEELVESLRESGILKARSISEKNLRRIIAPLETVIKWNIEQMLERAELKLPSNKWNPERFKKFYELWNSIEIEALDERML